MPANRRVGAIVFLGVMGLCAAFAAEQARNTYGKLSGSWDEYSGELGDSGPPTANDTKVSFTFKGALAEELFRRLGARARVKDCIPDNIIEWRRRGDLDCIRDKETGLMCSIGLDMKTGRSIIATEC